MIWESAQSIATSLYVSIETAAEATTDSVYYALYGSGDGHEGLTPLLEEVNKTFNPFNLIANMAVAGWELFVTGSVSEETMGELPAVVQGIIDSIYGGGTGAVSYTHLTLPTNREV